MYEVELSVLLNNLFACGVKKISIPHLKDLCEQLRRNNIYVPLNRNEISALTQDIQSQYGFIEETINNCTNNYISRGLYSNPEKHLALVVEDMFVPSEIKPMINELLQKNIDQFKPYFDYRFSREYVDKYSCYGVPKEIKEQFLKIISDYYNEHLKTPD